MHLPTFSSSRTQNRWNVSNDPDNPYNWPPILKISISVIISFGQLVTLMSTSMMAAMYGRKPVWLLCNAFYVLWNALCPVGRSPLLMVIGRFLAGSGASMGITLKGPIMADMHRKEDRGKCLAIATFVPYLGPALGPIIGGIITQKLDWPWLSYLPSIFNAIVWVVGLVLIRESYTPVLLARRRKVAATTTRASSLGPTSFWVAASRMAINLRRPMQLLWQRPIIQVIALIMALNFGLYCLLLSTFATLWINHYGVSEFNSTLHYIAVSLGTTVATQAGGRFMDWVIAKQKARPPDGSTSPEFRVPCLIPPVILIPIGLWYGWAAEVGAHWAVVDIGVVDFVRGSFLLAQTMLAYLLDNFEHAASANVASRMLSNVLGFVFPIFAPQLFTRLGYGWGNSLLAFPFIGLGCPAPLLLWVWGVRLRALGQK
ncbi:MFS general substrate transporter [Colletotrichum somersetense]|nr:MFS general substrate transporter [Colletotrichum somersetense]